MADIVTGGELSPGSDVRSDDQRALERWARTNVTTFDHPVGTCSMGPASDSNAVTDEHGCVYGVEGLFVADASIIPTVPTGTPNLPTIMVAEHVARVFDWSLRDTLTQSNGWLTTSSQQSEKMLSLQQRSLRCRARSVENPTAPPSYPLLGDCVCQLADTSDLRHLQSQSLKNL